VARRHRREIDEAVEFARSSPFPERHELETDVYAS
jgi:TPP-dependent pyruvate/acetoin dehydrogenase alpha subunit